MNFRVSQSPSRRQRLPRVEDIVRWEIHAPKNNAHARSEMTRNYNNHHYVQSLVLVGQYVTANISRLDRAATDNKRIVRRTIGIAGSKEQRGYKLQCLYGLLKGLHPTSALDTAISRKPHHY